MRLTKALIICLFTSLAEGQQQLTLDSCLFWSRDHFPASRQLQLLQDLGRAQKDQINTAWLPSLSGIGQASAQSAVTSITLPAIPGFPTITPPNKDQYKFYLDASQMIYDGGSVHHQKKLASLQNEMEQWKAESELFKIRERTIQVYFSVLLLQEQLNVLSISAKDLDALLEKTRVAYEAKAGSGYQLFSVQAEKEKMQQRVIETNAQRLAALRVLASLTGKTFGETVQLSKPPGITVNNELNRPELKAIRLSQRMSDVQKKLIGSRSIPRLSAFGQAGYANPALNFLKNQFEWYYIGGLRLSWNISGLYNSGPERRVSVLNKSMAGLQEETFIYNLNLQQIQQIQETRKNEALLDSDARLIELRTRIRTASKLQYDNGTLTLSDYLKDLNAEESARSNRLLHELSLLQSVYLTNLTNGNQ